MEIRLQETKKIDWVCVCASPAECMTKLQHELVLLKLKLGLYGKVHILYSDSNKSVLRYRRNQGQA
jgi:hypothetical protein